MTHSIFWKRIYSFLNFLKNLWMVYWGALLLLLIGVCLPLLVFEQLAVVIWRSQAGFSWDDSILLAIHATANAQLDGFAVVLTKLGVRWGVVPAATVIALGLFYRRQWRSLIYLLTTVIGNGFINVYAKELLHRVRPALWNTLTPELDYSFPSGHAMSSMSFVAALVILTWGTVWSGWVIAIGSLFVVGIGWTRLYLGVHFPSDVLAGWSVALAWAIGVSLVIRPHLSKPSLVSEEALTVEEDTKLNQQA